MSTNNEQQASLPRFEGEFNGDFVAVFVSITLPPDISQDAAEAAESIVANLDQSSESPINPTSNRSLTMIGKEFSFCFIFADN